MKRYTKNSFVQFRSYSYEHILQKTNHHRSDSCHSVDLFTLVIPPTNGTSLSPLICSICSLPMMKPTLLPCQHTFCLKCIENNQQIRSGSLPVYCNNGLLSNDNQRKQITCQKCFRTHFINSLSDLEENQSIELLINTLLCETCQQLYPSNQIDTCIHCFGVLCPNCYDDHLQNHQNDSKINENTNQQISDNQILKTKPVIESTKQILEIENNENIDPSEITLPKKKSNNLFRKIMNPSRHRQSSSVSIKDSSTKIPASSIKQTSSDKLPQRPKLIINTNIEETTKIEPVTPVRRFLNLFDQYSHTSEHIKQCKQRQSELDRSVKKLIEVLIIKTNEKLNEISSYWVYLKQFSLDQCQVKTTRFQLIDYLLKTCCSTLENQKQIELYFQENDEITAALQVLSTTLIILNNQQTLSTISQLFDREEQITIRTLRRHLESLLSSYADELSFIMERIDIYETRFSAWKNSNLTDLDSITYEWTQIIEHDYPSLIEKISNDFITKIPQIEKILVQMLKNMKKRLLNTTNQTSTRRTSDC